MKQLPDGVAFPAAATQPSHGPQPPPCPNCDSQETRTIYAVRGVPLHSCVLLESQDAATAFERGDLAWCFCRRCTFLFNAAFDPASIDYSQDYEETQGFSGTFSRWLAGVARDLVERQGLSGKRVVEVGCGRGDFLELVCRLGDNEGIGVDPSSTAGRVDHSAGRGLRFLQEDFGPEHAGLQADAVLCRHTLEHLQDARGLLASVARALRPGGFAFFEVPDVERQLTEGAFWDVYYEHCAYYGEPSLRALFESCGFEVDALERVYGDQYLQIRARPLPADAPASPKPPSAAVREEWNAAVERFAESCRSSIANWNAFKEQRIHDGAATVLWGSGSKATGFLSTLDWPSRPGGLERVVDINPDKWGRFVAGTGQRIVAPEELREHPPQHVVIMNPIYVEEIRADLARLGCEPEILALGT